MELSVIRKDREDFNLTFGLKHSEFLCKCKHETCTYTLVNPKLLVKYKELRTLWGKLLIVNSGFRCQRHNEVIGGAKDSYHKKGSAVDLRPASREDLILLYNMAQKLFDKVILYADEGFIHCHMED